MGFFFLETYQAAKFIERDGEFQVEDDLDTGEVVTMYITICIHNMYYICICRLNYWARNSTFMIAYCLKTSRQTNIDWWNRRLKKNAFSGAVDSSKSPGPRPVALSRVWEGPGGGGHGAGGGDSVSALAMVSSRAAISRLYSRYGVGPATHQFSHQTCTL